MSNSGVISVHISHKCVWLFRILANLRVSHHVVFALFVKNSAKSGEMSLCLRVLAALPKDLSWILSTHPTTHNYLYLPVLGIEHPLLAFISIVQAGYA